MAKTKTDARTLIAGARRRESTLPLCLAGDLAAEHEELEAELEAVMRPGAWTAGSLADTNPTIALSERIVAVEAQMAEHTTTLRFRALKRSDWEALIAAHPGREGKEERWNWSTFAPAIVSACLVDPVMTVAEVDELFDVVNEGQRDALFGAAFQVNQEATTVPFSERASVVTRWRAQNSTSLATGESLEASS